MNDNIIINIISKTYFIIVSFFIFIAISLFILFVTLQNGLFLNELSLSNIQIKQLYIKWDERIDVSVKEIFITDQENEDATKIDFKNINKYLTALSHTKTWFSAITLEQIVVKDVNASFKYKIGEDGFVLARSKDIDLNASIYLHEENLVVQINKLLNRQRKLNASGDVYFDNKGMSLYTNINVKISDEADINLYTKITTSQLFYKLVSNKKITSIKHIISIANLPKEVRYWAYDAIDMQSVNITSAYGYLDYNDINNAYKNVQLKAVVNKVNYTYNPELDAIHASKVDLEFSNGIFNIKPFEAYSYGMFLDKSTIKVDFTQKEELLTLHLLFDGIVNKDILKILNAYKIKLPFIQNSGVVSSDLKVFVGLRNIGVKAKGDFFTKEANFDYIGLNVDIYDAYIQLDNYDVSIKNMRAKYEDMAKAKVNVKYNAKSESGTVDFKFDHISLMGASLKANKEPLTVSYNIFPNNDTIDVKKSLWNFQNQSIQVDALSLPFDLNELKIKIPTTFVEIKNIGNAFVSGSVDLNDMSTKLDVDILKFHYDGIEFSQSNTPIKVEYKKKIAIYSDDIIHFSVSGSKYTAEKLFLDFNENVINLKHTSIKIGKYISAKIYAKYNLDTKQSHISLSKFVLKDPNTDKILYKNGKILLSAEILKDSIHISSKELNADFTSQDTGWRLKLRSIGRVATHSQLLKKFHVTDGEFTLYKNSKDKYTRFKSTINYPYKILVKNDVPLEKYEIQGKIYKEKIYIDVNDDVHVTIKDAININLEDSVININESLRAINEINSSSESNSSLNIIAKGVNSYIYVQGGRKVLYESLDMQYYDKILTAQLNYKKGDAGLRLEKNEFHLYGKKFNDEFMNKLLTLSNFTDGDLEFSLNGNIHNYNGVVYINNTTIKDYKILNNVLAFVNTIPSLITFTIPGYSNDGLLVDQAYVNFKTKDNLFNLTDIYLDSKEIDILGKGTVDINKDDMNVTLNLKTDLGSNLAKVPVVGYILLGKDTISTTLNITGKVEDPAVKSLIAKEIVVAPINIIKRTLSLPYNFIEDTIKKATNKDKEKK